MQFTCANFDVKVEKRANIRVRAKWKLIWSQRYLQWHVWPCSLTYRPVIGNGLFHYLCRGVVFTVIAPSINATCWGTIASSNIDQWKFIAEKYCSRDEMSANFLLPEASARRGDELLIVIPGSPSTLINYYMDTPILITFWTEPAVTFMKLMNRTVTLLIN